MEPELAVYVDEGKSTKQLQAEVQPLLDAEKRRQAQLLLLSRQRVAYQSANGKPLLAYFDLLKYATDYRTCEIAFAIFYTINAIVYAAWGSTYPLLTLTSNNKLQFHIVAGVPFSILCPVANPLFHVEWIGFAAFLSPVAACVGNAIAITLEMRTWTRAMNGGVRFEPETVSFQGIRPFSFLRAIGFTILYALVMQQAGVPEVSSQYFVGVMIGGLAELFWLMQERDRSSYIGYISMWSAGVLAWVWVIIQSVWTLEAYGSHGNNYSAVIIVTAFLFWVAWGAIRGVDLFVWVPRNHGNDKVEWVVMYVYEGLTALVFFIVFWVLFYQLAEDVPIVIPTSLCV